MIYDFDGYTVSMSEGTDSLGTYYADVVVLSPEGEEVYRNSGSDWYRVQGLAERWLDRVLGRAA
jgi:hypothetical protein